MKLKASDERDNEDLENLEEFTVENWDKTLMVTMKLANGKVIKAHIDNLGKKAITEDYWFGFDYDGYAFNGELFYVDDNSDSDMIALNIYTTVDDPEAEDGLGCGSDIGAYAECYCKVER